MLYDCIIPQNEHLDFDSFYLSKTKRDSSLKFKISFGTSNKKLWSQYNEVGNTKFPTKFEFNVNSYDIDNFNFVTKITMLHAYVFFATTSIT